VAYGKKTIVFTVDIQHAVDLAALFRKCSITAEAVWGTDPERAAKFSRHRSGETTVMLNCQVTREGYDDPEVECIVLATPHKSALPLEQEIGRGTRIPFGINNLFEAREHGQHISKEKCVIIGVMDIARKHKLFSLPSLLGLPVNLDCKGKSVTQVKEQFDRVAREFPTADLTAVESLSKLETIAENIALFQVHYPPEIAALSDLGWRKSADGYQIAVNRDLVSLQQDLRGDWQIKGKVGDVPVDLSAQNLPGAMNAADNFILAHGGIKPILARNSRWKGDPPTMKQISLCRVLHITVPPGATKGQVSAAIDQKMARRA
jgi:hypothetical protein